MATRVYKYGLIPIGYPPREAIDELYRANKLWNDLVWLHREHLEGWDDARCSASIEYSEKLEELEKKEEEITQAFDALKQVRMEEGTRDESNPKLKRQRDIIDQLKADKASIFVDLKPLRKAADKLIDTKDLNNSFRLKVNAAASTTNNGLYSRTAGEFVRYVLSTLSLLKIVKNNLSTSNLLYLCGSHPTRQKYRAISRQTAKLPFGNDFGVC